MIPADLNEFLKKNQIPKEEAIAEVLRDWAKSNDVSLTAVVSITNKDQSFNTVAVGAFAGPLELLMFHHVAHKGLVDMTLKEKSDEDL